MPCTKLLRSTCTKLSQNTSCVPVCSWIQKHCIQDANPNSTLSPVAASYMLIQCLLFTFIFLFPETFCSSIRTSCHHFCESSFVPQFFLHFPSDFHKLLLLLPPCLSSDGPLFLPSVWADFCSSSPSHDSYALPMFPLSPLSRFHSSLPSSLPAVLCCVPSHPWVEVVLQEGREDAGKGGDLVLELSRPHMSTKMQMLERSIQRADTGICVPSWPGYPEHKACLFSYPQFSVHSFNCGEWLALEVPLVSFRSCPSYPTSASHFLTVLSCLLVTAKCSRLFFPTSSLNGISVLVWV